MDLSFATGVRQLVSLPVRSVGGPRRIEKMRARRWLGLASIGTVAGLSSTAGAVTKTFQHAGLVSDGAHYWGTLDTDIKAGANTTSFGADAANTVDLSGTGSLETQ